MIVGYSLALIVFVPNYGFILQWTPSGHLHVVRTFADHPSSSTLAAGDEIAAIDHVAIVRSPWRFLFPLDKESVTYTVARGDTIFTATVPFQPLAGEMIRWRLIPGLIGLGAWLVGAIVLLLASPRNRDGWRVGLTTIGLAVVLAVSEAALYSIPLAWLIADPLLPLMTIAFAELALLSATGKPPSRALVWMLRILYGAAILLGLVAIFDMLILIPQNVSVYHITGIKLYDWILLSCATGLLLNPVFLVFRYFSSQTPSQRQQVRLLLVVTALAVSPLCFLIIFPRVIAGVPLIPWEVGFASLVLLPLGYGYVIYRRNFLNLDIVATRTLTLFLLLFVTVLLYSISSALLALQKQISLIEPIPGLFALGIAGAGAIGVSGRVARNMKTLVFGSNLVDTRTLGDYAGRLARHPEPVTLTEVCRELVEVLEVSQAVLWLQDDLNRLQSVFVRGVGQTWLADVDDNWPAQVLVRETLPETEVHPIFQHLPWAEVIAPLASSKDRLGLLVLGPKVPENYFHSLDVALITQMVASLSITAENIRLLEASRAMSRELLRVRERERIQLASRLHDEPLQQITLVAGALDALAADSTGAHQRVVGIQHQRAILLGVTQQLRAICADLHPPILDQGLVAAIEGMLYEFEIQSGLAVERNLHVSWELDISESIVIPIYHILTEALANARKHAQATRVAVALMVTDGKVHLSIADDGMGMRMSEFTLLDLFYKRHFGMVGMYEWARSVEGHLSIDSEPNQGTTITLSVPL